MGDKAGKAQEPKQKTKPKKGEPVEIPVPKRGTIDRMLKRAARKKPS